MNFAFKQEINVFIWSVKMVLSIFTPCVTGMDAQAHAQSQVSSNIANMRTVGYKSNETLFYTMLGTNPVVRGTQSGVNPGRTDIHAVGYYDRTNIEHQGNVYNTSNNFDVAINGTGNAFFVVNDTLNNKTYYTRAGDFSTRSVNGQVYLINNSGMRVQGFPALESGGFGSTPQDIILDYQERIPSTPTTWAEITANVPADGVDTSSYSLTVYGPNNDGKTMNMLFSKVEGVNNLWDLSFTIDGGTVTTAEPLQAQFSPDGKLLSPQNFNVTVTWDDGSTNTIAMNIENMTQYAGGSGITHIDQDGVRSGDLVKTAIGEDGIVYSSYSNGKTLNHGKLAVAMFEAPGNLTAVSGTLFEANNSVGNMSYVKNNKNYVQPQALEQSTVNIEEEFSTMILVQRAYSSNVNTFTVNNEMLELLVDLKS